MVSVYTWMHGRSKYNLLLSLYRWLAANTNSQGFKAHIQEDCGDLEGVVAYRMHFSSSFFPINITWADTAHQVFPSISNLTRNSEKGKYSTLPQLRHTVYLGSQILTLELTNNCYQVMSPWSLGAAPYPYKLYSECSLLLFRFQYFKLREFCRLVLGLGLDWGCDLPAPEPESILYKEMGTTVFEINQAVKLFSSQNTSKLRTRHQFDKLSSELDKQHWSLCTAGWKTSAHGPSFLYCVVVFPAHFLNGIME